MKVIRFAAHGESIAEAGRFVCAGGYLCRFTLMKCMAVRKDSPLIVGLGKGENFIASDVPAILSKTRDIYRLKDQEIVRLTREKVDSHEYGRGTHPENAGSC